MGPATWRSQRKTAWRSGSGPATRQSRWDTANTDGCGTLLGLSQCGIDDAIQELDNELNAVRGRLRILSMQRTQRVRADIHRTLSDRSSPLSDTVISAPKRNVTRQPPRTATVCEGGKSKNGKPATKRQVQVSDCVVLPSVSNVAGEGVCLGSEASNFASPAPKTSAGTGGDPGG